MTMLYQTFLSILQQADRRGGRSVILVPEAVYANALMALACTCPVNAGRTVRLTSGNLLSVVNPKTPCDEITEGFNLYLCGWGAAKPAEEKSMTVWFRKALEVFTEIS